MEDTHKNKTSKTPETGTREGQRAAEKSTLYFDPCYYLPDLEDEDISEDQKLELIRTLYAIVQAFIDLGFKVDFADAPCGKEQNSEPLAPQCLRDHVYSNHHKTLKNSHSDTAKPAEAEQKGIPL